ncbi:MAG: DNA-directed RNA polymerase subunit M [Candidatus Hadarchaeota archaeon]|nr:DNA-directed RNA polymerase subunit M [Candidatus Hadarchaeota archaeon]
MEFCPKCGSVLLPRKVGREIKLTCPRCKFTRRLKKRAAYKISEKGKEIREITVIDKEEKKKKKPPEQEYEIDFDYYEDLYE